MDYFVFGGVDSRTYSAYVFDAGTDASAALQYEVEEIPGRNGDLLLNARRRPNLAHEYSVIVIDQFSTNYRGLVNALLAVEGYARLEDTIHPDEFYLAYFSEGIAPTISRNRDAGKFRAVFIRKPQRFLKSGETAVTLSADGEIVNPTLYPAKPLLRVYGTGTVGIGSYEFEITEADGYTDIDCDMMECYKGTAAVNCNGNVSFTDYTFPQLVPGTNAVELSTGITSIEITPRWYQL